MSLKHVELIQDAQPVTRKTKEGREYTTYTLQMIWHMGDGSKQVQQDEMFLPRDEPAVVLKAGLYDLDWSIRREGRSAFFRIERLVPKQVAGLKQAA